MRQIIFTLGMVAGLLFILMQNSNAQNLTIKKDLILYESFEDILPKKLQLNKELIPLPVENKEVKITIDNSKWDGSFKKWISGDKKIEFRIEENKVSDKFTSYIISNFSPVISHIIIPDQSKLSLKFTIKIK